MRKTIVSFALTLAPSIVMAQQTSSSVQGSASVSATATTPKSQASMNGNAQATSTTSTSGPSQSAAPSTYTAENRARIDAAFGAARQRNLPQQPIRDRIAEGQAKGASEAQVTLSAQRAETRLEATQQAMIRAGRQPSQSDVSSGYQAMVHGATAAQVEAVAQRTPPNRSLVVAFDALARLEAQGMSPDRAAAQVVTQLDANASDQSLGQLGTTASTSLTGSAALPHGGVSAAGSAVGAATAAGATGTATAGVAGTVGGLVKPPTE